MRIIAIILLLFICNNGSSQILKWRAKEMTYAKVDKPNYVASHPKTHGVNLLITYDIDGERISIYLEEKLTYDIVSYEEVNQVPDSVKAIYLLKAVNKQGEDCTINLQLFKKATYDAQMQVIYPDLFVIYNLKNMDN